MSNTTNVPQAHLPAFASDRRAFLASAPALALLTAGPALAATSAAVPLWPQTTPRAAWDAAVARFEHAKANFKAAAQAHDACGGDTSRMRALGELVEDSCDAMVAAEATVFETPAPDLSALQWKLEHLRDYADGSVIETKHLDTVLADLRRIEGKNSALV
jgi:hypothetical protein